MADDGIDALRAQLRAEPPAGVARLTAEELADLTAAIAAAQRRQARALEEAGEQALGHLPKVLRIAVRKVVR
jgi:hypothetical protein